MHFKLRSVLINPLYGVKCDSPKNQWNQPIKHLKKIVDLYKSSLIYKKKNLYKSSYQYHDKDTKA